MCKCIKKLKAPKRGTSKKWTLVSPMYGHLNYRSKALFKLKNCWPFLRALSLSHFALSKQEFEEGKKWTMKKNKKIY